MGVPGKMSWNNTTRVSGTVSRNLVSSTVDELFGLEEPARSTYKTTDRSLYGEPIACLLDLLSHSSWIGG
jgi:hypothetical protein